MMELILAATEISDLYAFGELAKIRELPVVARQVIRSGGRVVIRQAFVNAKPVDVKVFTIESEVDAWEQDIDDLIKKMVGK
jgi:hypothetical protein